jgi:hypothetical protein
MLVFSSERATVLQKLWEGTCCIGKSCSTEGSSSPTTTALKAEGGGCQPSDIESSVHLLVAPVAGFLVDSGAVTTFEIVSALGAQGNEVCPFEAQDLNLVKVSTCERARMSTQATEGSMEGRSTSPRSERGDHRSPSRSPSPPGQPDMNTPSGGHAAEIGEFLRTTCFVQLCRYSSEHIRNVIITSADAALIMVACSAGMSGGAGAGAETAAFFDFKVSSLAYRTSQWVFQCLLRAQT